MVKPASAGRTRWKVAAIPIGIVMMLLGAWVFFVPLVGPYFNFGFFTSTAWTLSTVHWELLLGPGIALFLAGLMTLLPAGPSGSLSLISALAGVWLLTGSSLHPIWSGQIAVTTTHPQWLTSLLWIGYFYGTGAIALYLSGLLHGLLGRRQPTVYHDQTTIEETPIKQRERILTRT